MAWLGVEPGAMSVPLAMLVVFGAAKLMAEIFERLGQPGVVGEIVAGILIGPHVLQWIHPSEVLSGFAELGVMFLLFRVGLEVKASELMRVGGTAFLVALAGVVVPFCLGWAIMQRAGYPPAECIFVGASMVATSVGITAQVLSSKGLLYLESSKIILGAAVIDDILGLVVLAMVSSAVKGQINFLEIGLTAVLALGFTAVVAKWGTRTMSVILPKAEAGLRAGEVQFNLALILLFALAVLAVYAGVAAIIGAFLAGMAFSDAATSRVQDLIHGLTELMVPFFLAGIGLKLDLTAFRSGPIFGLALIIFVAAVASKMIGCGFGAAALGRKEMIRVGFGMVPRGEVGMVVAQIGLSMGVIEDAIYGVVVFMAVGTTVVSPMLLKIAYRGVPAQDSQEQFGLG